MDDKFFNIHNIGKLKEVNSIFYPFYEDRIYITDDESIIKAQQKLYSLKCLGDEYDNIYITYIPAKEFDYYGKSSECPIPLFIKDLSGKADCQLSGRRSAIYFKDSIAYRLKGCGNQYIGFNLANVDDLGENHLEIRGAQFKNTCLREQYITNIINKMITKFNFLPGNIPIGFIKYNQDLDIEANLLNEAKLIDKYCGLFITSGEKRLGYNLFEGINNCLNKLIQNETFLNELANKIDTIKLSLPSKNFKDNDILFNDNIFISGNDLFDYYGYLKKEKDKEGIFYKVVMLMSHIAYEVGYIKTIFTEGDLNWGTYDYHCNAHLDNFILIQRNEHGRLLAPVDFDLSFTRDQFIDINYKKGGIEQQVSFDDLSEREKNCLLMQLMGFNMIPNIEVNVLNITTSHINHLKTLESLINLLKENMAYYFYKGFSKETIDTDYESVYELAYTLI